MKKSYIYSGHISESHKNLKLSEYLEKINYLQKLKNIIIFNSSESVLIKVGEDKYVPLSTINNIIDEIIAYIGLSKYILRLYPTKNNPFYIEKDSLLPYFDEDEKNEKLTLQKLKKQSF